MYYIVRFRKLLPALLFLLTGGYGYPLMATEPTPEQQEAGIIVSRYVQGLIEGDMGRIARSLSREAWIDKKGFIEAPGYGKFLKRQYQGATFRISEYRTLSSTEVEVIVALRFSSGHEKAMKFLLRSNPPFAYPHFRIVEETM